MDDNVEIRPQLIVGNENHSETRKIDEAKMAGILQRLGKSLEKLANNSETKTSTLQNIQNDLLLRFNHNGSDANAEITESSDGNMLDVESTLDRALAQRAESGDKANNNSSVLRPDPGPQSSVVDSLTQAFTPQKATSPPNEGQIAELINNMLVWGLSAEMVKDRVEKHPPPENCENLSVTTVNEDVWDLLPRKSRSVGLAFQAVQATMLQGTAALINLAGSLVTSITNGDTPNTRDVLNHVMDSVALLGNANWKLNMKRRELIKPDLNPPFTRLCREEVKPTLKLFGDDLPKHMKDMSEATKVGKQMQKHSQDNKGSAQSLRGRYGRFRPYDREQSHITKPAGRDWLVLQDCIRKFLSLYTLIYIL
jgi:hypothetical protein